jgi:hypothetical protein
MEAAVQEAGTEAECGMPAARNFARETLSEPFGVSGD